MSAYEVAVANGFFGSQQDWLASLVGAQGQKGDTGATGPKGDAGASGSQGQAGTNGTNGRTPVFSCVIRWDANQSGVTRYWFAQKYDDEPDTAYVDKYRLGSDQASNNTGTKCVDLRTK